MQVHIPKAAWPAMARFDEARFHRVYTAAAVAEHGTEEDRQARRHVTEFMEDFKTWATQVLQDSREVELVNLLCEQRIKAKTWNSYLAPRLLPLLEADLTLKERERLVTQLSRLTQPPLAIIKKGLLAAERPYAFKDISDPWRRPQS